MLAAKKKFGNYFSKKMLSIFLLGFSSGLPLALTLSLLQAWFKVSGVSLVSIGLLSLTSQPYAYKFFWAPLVDRFKLPIFNFMGHKRSWILSTQLLMILVIIIMAHLSPKHNPLLLSSLAFVLAFISATQDIVIDAYRVQILTNDERGLGTALSIEGYRFAMLISSGLGLVIAGNLGFKSTYLIMASLMIIGIIGNLIAEHDPYVMKDSENLAKTIVAPIKQFLSRDKSIYLLGLIVLYKLSDVLSHSLNSMFFLDLNFTLAQIGTINKIVGLIASLIGIMLAGILMTRINLYKAILFFGCLQGITNILYMILAIVDPNLYLTFVVVFIESICSGMGTSALVALLTGLCDHRYSATQFALLSSFSSISRIYIGSIAGFLVNILGWKLFYLGSAIMVTPSIFLIVFLKKQIIACDPRGLKN